MLICPIPLSLLDPKFSGDRVCDEMPAFPFLSRGGVNDCIELQGICSDFSCLIVDDGIEEVC